MVAKPLVPPVTDEDAMLKCQTDSFDREKVERLRSKISEVEGVFELFRVLADDTRTKIIYLLQHAELCVHDLAQLLHTSSSAVSHHLRQLRNLRLVRVRRQGKIVYYSLADDHIVALIRQAQAHYNE